MITPSEIEGMIALRLPGCQVIVTDMTGTSDHFQIEVTAAEFSGKPLIEQHKIIFDILGGEIDRRIHAVKLKTRALKI